MGVGLSPHLGVWVGGQTGLKSSFLLMVALCCGFFIQHWPPGCGDGGDVSVGWRGSRCRRWSMASRTSPAPSATAPVCASWPLAPALEPSSCILPVPVAPTLGSPGRGGDMASVRFGKGPHPLGEKKKLQVTLLVPGMSQIASQESGLNAVSGGRWWAKKVF